MWFNGWPILFNCTFKKENFNLSKGTRKKSILKGRGIPPPTTAKNAIFFFKKIKNVLKQKKICKYFSELFAMVKNIYYTIYMYK